MKKLLTLALALLVTASMAACSNDDGDVKKGESKKDDVVEEKVEKKSEEKKEDKVEEKNEDKVEEKAEKKEEKAEKKEDKKEEKTEEKVEKKEEKTEKKEEKTEEKEEKKEDKKADNGEAEAREVAEDFLDALCKFDIVEMSECMDLDSDAMVEEIGFTDLYDCMGQMVDEMGLDEFGDVEDEVQNLMNAMVDGILDNTSYSITDSAYDDGKWTFTVDLDSIKLSEVSDVFDDEEVMEEIQNDLIADYADKDFENMSEEDAAKLVENMMSDMFVAMTDVVKESFDDAEIYTKECKVVVVKNSKGEWIVDESSTTALDAFNEIINE